MDIEKIIEEMKNFSIDEKFAVANKLQQAISSLVLPHNPVGCVLWVPVEMVEPNDYNPNAVAPKEMQLLYISISHDGLTQPIVTIFDEEKNKYIVVDGFHRYFTCKSQKDIYEKNSGRIPIVVLNKSINDRMAATVRHNRARGEHSINGMSNIVFNMLNEGWNDATICNRLGLDPTELVKIKHISGFSKLLDDYNYSEAWKTRKMLLLEKQARQKLDEEKK